MTKTRTFTVIAALAYAVVFYRVYVDYVYVLYEYADYDLIPRQWSTVAFTFGVAILPVLFSSRWLSAASMISAFAYCLYYVPAVFVPMFSSSRPLGEVYNLQLALMVGMILLFSAGHWRFHGQPRIGGAVSSRVVESITVVFVLITVVAYHDHMRLVGFEDVYDLRFETTNVGNALVGYVVMWLSYVLLPYSFARALLYKEWFGAVLALAGFFTIYMATGSKAAALTPVIMLGVVTLLWRRGNVLNRLLLALIGACGVLVYVVPDGGIFTWAKSLLFMRTLGSQGWAISVYYDYFTTHGLTYFSHLKPLDGLLTVYPYGRFSLGQVIGLAYTGSELANFNAGFWASDGIAALGIAGIFVISVIVLCFLVFLNRISCAYDPRFIALWLSGLAIAMLNIPFGTTLISGGGCVAIAMLLVCNVADANEHQANRPVFAPA